MNFLLGLICLICLEMKMCWQNIAKYDEYDIKYEAKNKYEQHNKNSEMQDEQTA